MSSSCPDVTGQQAAPSHSGHPAGSEWIAQQLQRAYLGLAATLAPVRDGQQQCMCKPQQQSQSQNPQQRHPQQQQQQLQQSQEASEQQQMPQQEHQQQNPRRNPGESRPPAAGTEGNHASVEPQTPHGVPDRIPAAIALLQSPESFSAQHQIERPKEGSKEGFDGLHRGLPESGPGESGKPEPQRKLSWPQVVGTQGGAVQHKSSPTPVFVPIVVAMEARDHKLMVEEWYSRQMVGHEHCR